MNTSPYLVSALLSLLPVQVISAADFREFTLPSTRYLPYLQQAQPYQPQLQPQTGQEAPPIVQIPTSDPTEMQLREQRLQLLLQRLRTKTGVPAPGKAP